ncbi:hypothetical protein SAMN06269185_0533 [Natronoarchaeum philippinense]|uniref:PH domain-containing protein n=1 Tax=Natronoarchaeum philippinense TaxID=558529 RepID=A0A285N8R4_NATPI|nr:hypothetical protein [Natronoarchaeum philippinense]SNZ04356.1 hypothetical protein SAMN06269185_0533 [Natronoarchaeum philippinense]
MSGDANTTWNGDGSTTWQGDATVSTVGRLCLYLQVAFFGGLVVVLAALVALLAVRSIRTGEFGVLALVTLLALVGGPFSLLYLLPVVSDRDARRSLSADLPQYGDLNRAAMMLAAVLGSVGILSAVYAGSWALLLAIMLVPAVTSSVAGMIDADGTLDATAGRLVVQDREVDLDAVADVRRIDLHGYAALWLSYPGPNDLDQPRLIAVPSAVADAAVAAVPDEPVEAEDRRPPVERIALVGTAAIFLGLAAVLAVVGHGTENAVALYALASMPGLFGVLVLYLAV